jgi:hypothetical protein
LGADVVVGAVLVVAVDGKVAVTGAGAGHGQGVRRG